MYVGLDGVLCEVRFSDFDVVRILARFLPVVFHLQNNTLLSDLCIIAISIVLKRTRLINVKFFRYPQLVLHE